MARIRTIKPEILSDERTATLSDGAFRLFTGLITLSDDFGNSRASASWLGGQIWWAHREPPRVAEFLRELCDAELATIYRIRGQDYVHLNGWSKHQRIDNVGKPGVPGPEDENDESTQIGPVCDGSRDLAESRGISPRTSATRGWKGREGKRKGIGEERETAAIAAPLSLDPYSPPAKRKSRKSRKVPMPETWQPSEKHIAQARDLNLDVGYQAKRLRTWADTNAEMCVNWNARFTGWLDRAAEFSAKAGSTNSVARPALRMVPHLGSSSLTPPPAIPLDFDEAKTR